LWVHVVRIRLLEPRVRRGTKRLRSFWLLGFSLGLRSHGSFSVASGRCATRLDVVSVGLYSNGVLNVPEGLLSSGLIIVTIWHGTPRLGILPVCAGCSPSGGRNVAQEHRSLRCLCVGAGFLEPWFLLGAAELFASWFLTVTLWFGPYWFRVLSVGLRRG
jgi:hypothetical protein